MKRYKQYQESGIEWIGEIPSHWKLIKLKHEFEFSVGGTPISGNSEYYTTNEDEGYKWVNISDLHNRVISDTKSYVTSEGIKNTSMDLVTKGSLLFSFKLSVGQVAFIDQPMYTNEAIASFSPEKNSNNLRYFYYASPIYIVKNANENIYGAKILNQQLIKNALMVLPPIEEQEEIANFLDKKTSQIENLISKKEELIETLKASKAKLISDAVTKGIDKDVPMKDSGVEWIGEIPSHWGISKLKFNTDKDFMYGANESGEDMQENQPRYIRITDINDDGELKNDTYVTLDYKKAKPYILEDKDILFARSGATVGKTFLYNKLECDLACFAGYLIKFTANKNKCNPKYIYYYTQSKMYDEFININISQATIQNVSAEKYKNLYNPLPPLMEQNDIVKYLDNKTFKIKNLISKVEEQIELLKKAKQKLITEVVTGKIDVTNL